MLYGPMPTSDQLAGRIPRVPPLLSATGLINDGHASTAAALLAWGRTDDDGWYAGLAFIYRVFRGSPLAALLTVWVPAAQVKERPGESYAKVPRVTLHGPASGWPALPPAYPKLGPDWLGRHHHVLEADPTGEYRDLRDAIRVTSRRT